VAFYVKVSDVAERLGLSIPRIYQLLQARQLPHVRRGARLLIPARAFEEWCEAETDHAHENVRSRRPAPHRREPAAVTSEGQP
jgi:excisionase family DNA binding protein